MSRLQALSRSAINQFLGNYQASGAQIHPQIISCPPAEPLTPVHTAHSRPSDPRTILLDNPAATAAGTETCCKTPTVAHLSHPSNTKHPISTLSDAGKSSSAETSRQCIAWAASIKPLKQPLERSEISVARRRRRPLAKVSDRFWEILLVCSTTRKSYKK